MNRTVLIKHIEHIQLPKRQKSTVSLKPLVSHGLTSLGGLAMDVPRIPWGFQAHPNPVEEHKGCCAGVLCWSWIPTRDNGDSATDENQGSRGRSPSLQPTRKNHETGFGKKPQGFKGHAC